jgi:hypothetical protein
LIEGMNGLRRPVAWSRTHDRDTPSQNATSDTVRSLGFFIGSYSQMPYLVLFASSHCSSHSLRTTFRPPEGNVSQLRKPADFAVNCVLHVSLRAPENFRHLFDGQDA